MGLPGAWALSRPFPGGRTFPRSGDGGVRPADGRGCCCLRCVGAKRPRLVEPSRSFSHPAGACVFQLRRRCSSSRHGMGPGASRGPGGGAGPRYGEGLTDLARRSSAPPTRSGGGGQHRLPLLVYLLRSGSDPGGSHHEHARGGDLEEDPSAAGPRRRGRPRSRADGGRGSWSAGLESLPARGECGRRVKA